MPAESTYCGPCGADHVRHAAAVQAAIVAIWGSAGLASYETELRAQRLARRRAPLNQEGRDEQRDRYRRPAVGRGRQRLEERLRELGDLSSLMRKRGSLASPGSALRSSIAN